MSNSSFSKSSSTQSPENSKHQNLIRAYNDKKNTYVELEFKYLSNFIEISSKAAKEFAQVEEEKEKISSKISTAEDNLAKLQQNLENLRQETNFREQKLKSEISILSSEKEAEISALADEIKYKTDLCEFFHKLSSTEILECGDKKTVRVRSVKEEMTFTIENDDIEGRLSFELNTFSQNPEMLPEWIKTKITFEEELCPTLFYNIYQILNC